MPIRGPNFFAELQRAQSRMHRAVGALEESSKEFDQKMEQLISQRSEEFLELARHYLPELSMETVQRSFDGVRNELNELLENKKRRELELEELIEQTELAIANDQTETDRVTEQLNEKAMQRDELQEEVAERLKKLPEYAELANEAALAEQRLTANEERMEQVDQEAAQKLPSYDNSKLFRYLYDRNFGTPDYVYRGFTRRMDRWLAKYVGFMKARKSYQFLKVTPKLMAAELDRRRSQFNELMGRIESIEARVEKEVGLTDVIAEGERLGNLRDDLVLKIDDQNGQLEAYIAELGEVSQSNGEYYDQALSKMRQHLEETEEIVLQQRARDTAEPQDDRIVADIVELNDLIGNLQPELMKLVSRRAAMVAKQGGFDEIVRRFRSSNYDSYRSVFPKNFDLDSMVERFINDDLDVSSLWKLIRQNQKFEESWAQQNSSDIFNNPSAQIIMHTMLDLATEALKHSARRSVHRRNSGGVFFPFPQGGSKRRTRRSSSRRSSSQRRSKPRRRRGGFTTGEGF